MRSVRSASRSCAPTPRGTRAGWRRPRGSASSPPACISRVLVVAFEKQSEASAAGLDAAAPSLRGALAGRHRQPVRGDVSRVHPPLRGTVRHRRRGRPEGPPERRAQPLCAGPPGGHHPRGDRGIADAVGPDQAAPLVARPRTVPARSSCPTSGRRPATSVRHGCTGTRCGPSHRSPPSTTTSTRGPGRDCADAVYRQAGIADPVHDLDVAELFVPYSWMEPMLLENLGLADPGRGWQLIEDGATTIERGPAGQPLRWSPRRQPDRGGRA